MGIVGKWLTRVDRTLYRTSDISRLVSEVVLGGIIALIVVDIILRYAFNRPLAYAVELVEFALSITVFLGIVVCTARQGHTNINIFLTRLSRRVQAAFNSFFYFVSAGLFGIIAWRSVIYAIDVQDIGQVSMMLKMPYHPFIFFIAFCALLIGLLFLSQLIHFVIEAIRK